MIDSFPVVPPAFSASTSNRYCIPAIRPGNVIRCSVTVALPADAPVAALYRYTLYLTSSPVPPSHRNVILPSSVVKYRRFVIELGMSISLGIASTVNDGSLSPNSLFAVT